MRKIGFIILVAVLFTATTVMAGGSVEWNWSDETMGWSNFQKSFGVKKWKSVYYSIKNTASWYHKESSMMFYICIKVNQKVVYSYSQHFEGAQAKCCFGPGEGLDRTIDLGNGQTGNLTVSGHIAAYPCGANTGRVRLKVTADYY